MMVDFYKRINNDSVKKACVDSMLISLINEKNKDNNYYLKETPPKVLFDLFEERRLELDAYDLRVVYNGDECKQDKSLRIRCKNAIISTFQKQGYFQQEQMIDTVSDLLSDMLDLDGEGFTMDFLNKVYFHRVINKKEVSLEPKCLNTMIITLNKNEYQIKQLLSGHSDLVSKILNQAESKLDFVFLQNFYKAAVSFKKERSYIPSDVSYAESITKTCLEKIAKLLKDGLSLQ